MTVRLPRAPLVLAAVWLAGVLIATSVSLLAVRLVAARVGDPAVVPVTGTSTTASAGASAPGDPVETPGTASPAPSSPSPTPSAAPPPATRAFASPAGSIGVQCTATTLRLLYATPAAGFGLDEQAVSGSEGEVRFRSGETRVRLRVSCATGQPVLVEQRTDGGDDDETDEGESDDDD